MTRLSSEEDAVWRLLAIGHLSAALRTADQRSSGPLLDALVDGARASLGPDPVPGPGPDRPGDSRHLRNATAAERALWAGDPAGAAGLAMSALGSLPPETLPGAVTLVARARLARVAGFGALALRGAAGAEEAAAHFATAGSDFTRAGWAADDSLTAALAALAHGLWGGSHPGPLLAAVAEATDRLRAQGTDWTPVAAACGTVLGGLCGQAGLPSAEWPGALAGFVATVAGAAGAEAPGAGLGNLVVDRARECRGAPATSTGRRGVLRLLGPEVTADTGAGPRPVSDADARLLLLLAAARGPLPVPEVAARLWPGSDPSAGARRVRAALHRLHNRLGLAPGALVVRRPGLRALDPGGVGTVARREFLELAEGGRAQRLLALERYRGDPASSQLAYDDLAGDIRETCREVLVETARRALDDGDDPAGVQRHIRRLGIDEH